ncbi:MAG: amidohydrolase [Caldilineae bacterium]|nr:MAG: amidohydrolase [Caldilineae bacterium]
MPIQVDLILYNAHIYTQWPRHAWVEAVAIHGGRILACGSDEEILPLARARTTCINLEGRLVLPGFTDSHIHFYDIAWRRGQLALYDAVSLQDLQARVRAYGRGLAPGAWLVGYGWNESSWPDPRFPTRHDLDPLTDGHPAILWRTDLHAAVANTAALQAAGIGPQTPDPPSGVIDRDDEGRPTGVLRELAINLVRRIIPPQEEKTATANLLAAAEELHRLGIVAVHDQRMKDHHEEGPEALQTYTRLRYSGQLPLRVSCNIEAAHLDHLIMLGLKSGFGDEWVRLGHVKLFADGSLGARTAWMLEPYEGEPHNRGMYLTPPEEAAALIQRAHRHGLAISIHAIGDRANREVLDIFAEVLAGESEQRPLIPHRIEHVQTIQPQDQPRLAEMGITASVQPIHCTDDIPNTDRFWGERGRNTYPFRTLLQLGTNLAFGSDAPVASPNPWWGIHAAVTRRRRDGEPSGGWYPEQCLTVAEAVEAYTLGAARAIAQEHQQGRLAPGYLADLVALDRDIFACPPREIADTQVDLTVLDGRIVHSNL